MLHIPHLPTYLGGKLSMLISTYTNQHGQPLAHASQIGDLEKIEGNFGESLLNRTKKDCGWFLQRLSHTSFTLIHLVDGKISNPDGPAQIKYALGQEPQESYWLEGRRFYDLGHWRAKMAVPAIPKRGCVNNLVRDFKIQQTWTGEPMSNLPPQEGDRIISFQGTEEIIRTFHRGKWVIHSEFGPAHFQGSVCDDESVQESYFWNDFQISHMTWEELMTQEKLTSISVPPIASVRSLGHGDECQTISHPNGKPSEIIYLFEGLKHRLEGGKLHPAVIRLDPHGEILSQEYWLRGYQLSEEEYQAREAGRLAWSVWADCLELRYTDAGFYHRSEGPAIIRRSLDGTENHQYYWRGMRLSLTAWEVVRAAPNQPLKLYYDKVQNLWTLYSSENSPDGKVREIHQEGDQFISVPYLQIGGRLVRHDPWAGTEGEYFLFGHAVTESVLKNYYYGSRIELKDGLYYTANNKLASGNFISGGIGSGGFACLSVREGRLHDADGPARIQYRADGTIENTYAWYGQELSLEEWERVCHLPAFEPGQLWSWTDDNYQDSLLQLLEIKSGDLIFLNTNNGHKEIFSREAAWQAINKKQLKFYASQKWQLPDGTFTHQAPEKYSKRIFRTTLCTEEVSYEFCQDTSQHVIHSTTGPARIKTYSDSQDSVSQYFIHGVELTQEEWEVWLGTRKTDAFSIVFFSQDLFFEISYCKNGQLHNLEGPARIRRFQSGAASHGYFLEGQSLSLAEWTERVAALKEAESSAAQIQYHQSILDQLDEQWKSEKDCFIFFYGENKKLMLSLSQMHRLNLELTQDSLGVFRDGSALAEGEYLFYDRKTKALTIKYFKQGQPDVTDPYSLIYNAQGMRQNFYAFRIPVSSFKSETGDILVVNQTDYEALNKIEWKIPFEVEYMGSEGNYSLKLYLQSQEFTAAEAARVSLVEGALVPEDNQAHYRFMSNDDKKLQDSGTCWMYDPKFGQLSRWQLDRGSLHRTDGPAYEVFFFGGEDYKYYYLGHSCTADELKKYQAQAEEILSTGLPLTEVNGYRQTARLNGIKFDFDSLRKILRAGDVTFDEQGNCVLEDGSYWYWSVDQTLHHFHTLEGWFHSLLGPANTRYTSDGQTIRDYHIHGDLCTEEEWKAIQVALFETKIECRTSGSDWKTEASTQKLHDVKKFTSEVPGLFSQVQTSQVFQDSTGLLSFQHSLNGEPSLKTQFKNSAPRLKWHLLGHEVSQEEAQAFRPEIISSGAGKIVEDGVPVTGLRIYPYLHKDQLYLKYYNLVNGMVQDGEGIPGERVITIEGQTLWEHSYQDGNYQGEWKKKTESKKKESVVYRFEGEEFSQCPDKLQDGFVCIIIREDFREESIWSGDKWHLHSLVGPAVAIDGRKRYYWYGVEKSLEEWELEVKKEQQYQEKLKLLQGLSYFTPRARTVSKLEQFGSYQFNLNEFQIIGHDDLDIRVDGTYLAGTDQKLSGKYLRLNQKTGNCNVLHYEDGIVKTETISFNTNGYCIGTYRQRKLHGAVDYYNYNDGHIIDKQDWYWYGVKVNKADWNLLNQLKDDKIRLSQDGTQIIFTDKLQLPFSALKDFNRTSGDGTIVSGTSRAWNPSTQTLDTYHRNDQNELHNLTGPAIHLQRGEEVHAEHWIEGQYFVPSAWEKEASAYNLLQTLIDFISRKVELMDQRSIYCLETKQFIGYYLNSKCHLGYSECQPHSTLGPAIYYKNGTNLYFLEGNEYTQEEWQNEIDKRKLPKPTYAAASTNYWLIKADNQVLGQLRFNCFFSEQEIKDHRNLLINKCPDVILKNLRNPNLRQLLREAVLGSAEPPVEEKIETVNLQGVIDEISLTTSPWLVAPPPLKTILAPEIIEEVAQEMSEIAEAGYRVAAKQLGHRICTLICAKAPRAKDFLKTSLGKALVFQALGWILVGHPTWRENARVTKLATELRVEGLSIIGEDLIQSLLGFLLEAYQPSEAVQLPHTTPIQYESVRQEVEQVQLVEYNQV